MKPLDANRSTAANASRGYWFGKNWMRFVKEEYSEERLREAERSLQSLFGVDGIAGKSFLDIGCGSGLFSLAAWRLGASHVVSVDVDENSVECCRHLWLQIRPDQARTWTIMRGSILDKELVGNLGLSDIVYSWGVLHHTGDMWRAIANASRLVAPGGLLLVGIYNWQGGRRGTITWQKLKAWYCNAPKWQRGLWESVYIMWKVCHLLLVLRNPISYIAHYKRNRGMSWFRDVSDWLGGYPYEAATPGEMLEFVRNRCGCELIKQNVNCGLGISEFLFQREQPGIG